MKPSEIKVGKTYRNRGAGRTTRKVLAIGDEHKPEYWMGFTEAPNDTGVLYSQNGRDNYLFLSSFSKWAGSEVEEVSNDCNNS